MADIEDEAEFGSHFLDSMLEVEMTEEDNELDVSKSCDPLETFPPVPTFDLQSETFSFKDVYKNSIPQPVLACLPLPTASKVPLVIKPSSVLIYSGDVPSQKSTTVLAPVQKISPKSNARNLHKNVTTNKDTRADETNHEKFLEEVFKPEFVKNVFIKADTPWDIALVSEEEMKYYKSCFADVSKVQYCRLHCTICDKHLGCAGTIEKKISVHNMLKVLICKPCYDFYGDGNFPCDKEDNCEIYCRWCGQGGALVCCSFCPRVFCKKCVRRNYGTPFLKTIEKASDWACFCCAQKPLWPHRAVCRALLEYLPQKKTDTSSLKDTSSCCKAAGLVRKKLRLTLEKNKVAASQAQAKPSLPAKVPENKNKTLPSTKTPRQILLNSVVKPKSAEPVKSVGTCVGKEGNKNAKRSSITNIFSPRSILTGNTIIRGIATSAPPKFFSTFPSSQLLQSPVIHGETLITPPSRLLLQAKPPNNPNPPYNSSYVRVSLTHQAPNLDVNKIPTVKIPHEVQGLVLRIIFPDNKMQYVRLTSDGSGCKASKDFPMPQFPERGATFVEENLAEAFKISKMLYDKLLQIRDKVNSRTKFTEESVFNSSVKKLNLAYDNAIELFKDLGKSLLENHEEWKKDVGSTVAVIDISDDDTTVVKKQKADKYSNLREKCKKLNDDSDIEVLDDVNSINGKTPVNSNYKEKYRLRSSSDQVKTYPVDVGVLKRKRGRPKRQNKRLKVARMQNGKSKDPLRIDSDFKQDAFENIHFVSTTGGFPDEETKSAEEGEDDWVGEKGEAEVGVNSVRSKQNK